MFLKLSNGIININKICWLDKTKIVLGTNNSISITEGDYATITEYIFHDYGSPSTKTKDDGASALLNTLHALLGGRGEAKPTTDRRARLMTRLKDFTPDELKQAASNLGADEFMQGANDNGKRYGTIDYLLRTSANVNKWLEEQPQKKRSMF